VNAAYPDASFALDASAAGATVRCAATSDGSLLMRSRVPWTILGPRVNRR